MPAAGRSSGGPGRPSGRGAVVVHSVAGGFVSGVVRGARAGSTATRISKGLQARRGMPRDAGTQVGRRIAKGDKFNMTRRHYYQANEVRLTNGKVVDSYTPGACIASRKHTQLAEVRSSTAKGYVREAADKYSAGEGDR